MKGKFLTFIPLVCALLATAAKADLTFCNKSNETIWTALAYYNDRCGEGEYDSKGWIILAPRGQCGDCKTVYHGDALGKRFFYYAQDYNSCHSWKGYRKFKVSQDRDFVVHEADRVCYSDNTRDFLELVASSCNHTLNFTVND